VKGNCDKTCNTGKQVANRLRPRLWPSSISSKRPTRGPDNRFVFACRRLLSPPASGPDDRKTSRSTTAPSRHSSVSSKESQGSVRIRRPAVTSFRLARSQERVRRFRDGPDGTLTRAVDTRSAVLFLDRSTSTAVLSFPPLFAPSRHTLVLVFETHPVAASSPEVGVACAQSSTLRSPSFAFSSVT